MQTGNKELQAYESIIQNLRSLKEEKWTSPREAESIGAIVGNLSALRDCVCDPDEFLVSVIPDCVASALN